MNPLLLWGSKQTVEKIVNEIGKVEKWLRFFQTKNFLSPIWPKLEEISPGKNYRQAAALRGGLFVELWICNYKKVWYNVLSKRKTDRWQKD